jgi:hypothetical protein
MAVLTLAITPSRLPRNWITSLLMELKFRK